MKWQIVWGCIGLLVIASMTGCAQTQTVLTVQPDSNGKISWKVQLVVPNDVFCKTPQVKAID